MNNIEFGKILELRIRKFAVSKIKLSISLPKTEEGRVLKNQLSNAGTSVGANYREVNRSRSKADFLNKIKISESETSETLNWLEIITDLNWLDSVKLIKLWKKQMSYWPFLAPLVSIQKNRNNGWHFKYLTSLST